MLRSSICLLAALAWIGAAHAGRPLQTEDAGVLEAGTWEVETFASRLSAGGDHATGASVQLARGVGLNTQLALAYERAKAGSDRAQGLSFNGKTGLWTGAGKDNPPALTLAWALASAKLDGERWRHAATELNLVYTRAVFERYAMHANLGHARDEQARQRATTWGLALEHQGHAVSGLTLAPMAELFGDDRAAPWWNLGLRLTLKPEVAFVDASYGRQIAPDRPALFTLGAKFAF